MVHLQIKNMAYSATQLCLCVEGVEKTRWAHEAKFEKDKEGSKKHHGYNVFFNLKDSLATFKDNRLEPGFYSFPFSFVLPNWVPSSFIYSGAKAPKLSILYTIKAKISDAEINKSTLLPTIRGKRRLLVSQ